MIKLFVLKMLDNFIRLFYLFKKLNKIYVTYNAENELSS